MRSAMKKLILVFIVGIVALTITTPIFAQTQRYTAHVSDLLSEESAQVFAQALLRDTIFQQILQLSEIKNLIHFAELDEHTAKALLALSIILEFNDSITLATQRFADADIFYYTAMAHIVNQEEILSKMQANLVEQELIFRLTQIEIDIAQELLTATQLNELNDIAHLQALEESIAKLSLLMTLSKELAQKFENWQNPDEIRQTIENPLLGNALPISALNALAEIYLQLDRPQKALEVLQNIDENLKNECTAYLSIRTALYRGENSLAQMDIERILTTLDDNHPLSADFFVLQGDIAQAQNNTETMCTAYESACARGDCVSYYDVQHICF